MEEGLGKCVLNRVGNRVVSMLGINEGCVQTNVFYLNSCRRSHAACMVECLLFFLIYSPNQKTVIIMVKSEARRNLQLLLAPVKD